MGKPYYLGGAKSNGKKAKELVHKNIIPKLQESGIPAKDTPRALEKAQDALLPEHSEHLDEIAEVMPTDWAGDDITQEWENDQNDALDYSMDVYMESGLGPSKGSGSRGPNAWIIFINDPEVKAQAEDMAKQSGKTAHKHKSEMWKSLSDEEKQPYKDQAKKEKVVKKGGKADPSLNPGYCDGHISQCQDFYDTCQNGGKIDASINHSFCDAHNSQCKDFYSSCGGGLSEKEMHRQYKKYKKLYKKLTRNKK